MKRETKYKLLISVIFIAAVIIAMLAYDRNYMRKTEELSLFLPTGMYFADCLRMPGGLLTWMATYLTQYFYHPLIGAIVYSISLFLLSLACYKGFRLRWQAYPLAFLPAALFAVSYFTLGYAIFTLKTPGVAYASVLGCLAACLWMRLYRLSKPLYLRIALILLMAFAGYPLFGAYALFAIALCAVYSLTHSAHRSKWAILAVTALAIVDIPLLCQYSGLWHLPAYQVYIVGLPAFLPGEGVMWLPYALACAILLAMAALTGLKKPTDKFGAVGWTGAGAFACACAAVFVFNCHDPNLRLTLDMDRALQNGHWQQAEKLLSNFKGEPTRLNTMLGYISLIRQGKAEESLFAIKRGNAQYAVSDPRKANVMRDAAAQLLNYHFGRVNNAYRWGMEDLVEYGVKPLYLQNMVKCCIVNGEGELADKYLRTLEQTKYHKHWASLYRQFVDEPDLVSQSPELSEIQALASYTDALESDVGLVDQFLIDATARTTEGSFQTARLSAICAMLEKDLDASMARISYIAPSAGVLPRHFQEAVLLWSFVNKNDAFQSFAISPQTMNRFQNFLQMREGRTFEQIAEVSKSQFSDTYWHYFFFEDQD